MLERWTNGLEMWEKALKSRDQGPTIGQDFCRGGEKGGYGIEKERKEKIEGKALGGRGEFQLLLKENV